MNKIYTKFIIGLLFILGTVGAHAQVTVTNPANTTPGLAATYTDLALAVTALNAQTAISGPVIITLDPANPQTAPVGGYTINAILTGASAVNRVTFEGSANTITAPATHVVGSLHDAIFEIIGSDFMTIQNFTMLENAANTTTAAATNNMTEFGVAIFYLTTTNGSQNITLQGNTITLNRTYQNTFGIYANATHTATAVTTSASATTTAGGNNNLRIYSNNISNVNQGIVVVGPLAASDYNTGVEIGGTAPTANTITNYGTTGTFSGYANVSGTVNGVLLRNSIGFTVSFNTVTSSVGGVIAGTLNGIQIPAASVTPTGTFTNTINSNSISLQSGLITGVMNGITYPSGSASATSTANITSNNFHTFGHTVAGTGAITFISVLSTNLFTTINNNTFTNISVNTTGSVTFISNSTTIPSTGSRTVSNNSIVTAFNKTGAGGTITFFTSGSFSVNGSINTFTGNNFSNITVTGATAIGGWVSAEGNTSTDGPAKTFTGNTFNNITGGTSGITIVSFSFGGSTSNISSNTITNITGQSTITGLSMGANNNGLSVNSNTINNLTSTGTGGTVTGISSSSSGTNIGNISQNTINTLSSTGVSAVSGILISGATTTNVFKNKIYNLSGSNASSTVNGLNISGGTLVSAYNNIIGDLRTPAANAANPLVGINVGGGTTVNIRYNTVWLNATSSGALFGSSAVSASTTPTLELRNNIFVNNSTPVGATGFSSAYRRSTTTLSSYATASNNNLFYAGTPGVNNLIMYDGTTSYQTLATYKTAVAPRDGGSITENPSFLSLAGANATFLHIDPAIATQIESAAAPIAGITDDYDGNVRNASTPDIGADEFAGIALDVTGPTISYTVLVNTLCLTAPTFIATITDGSGVNVTAGTKPRLWYRKGSNANALPATNDNTTDGWKYVEATNASSPFSFTFDFLLLNGGLPLAGDVIHYFVVAQDLAGTANLGINAGSFAAAPPTVALNAAAFPVTGNNFYNILAPIPVSVTVGGGGTYTTLTDVGGLFEAINAGGLGANTTARILGNITETGTVSLNQISYGCFGSYTLTIQPDAAVTAILSGSNATALINLNGADNVIFDGSNNGSTSKDLTIRNTGTGPAMRLINDATTNIIRNMIVESQNSSTTSGTIFFTTSTGILGNSNNTINNCDVRDRSDAAGVPANAVYSNGSAGALNGSNTISGCNIFNFTGSGVLVASAGAGNGWTINPTSFYQTANRTTAITVISLQGGSGHSILNNSIGGSAADRSGLPFSTTNNFSGILLAVGTASATSVQGNSISNLNISGGASQIWQGISITSGNVNVGTITGNTIGGLANVWDTIRVNYDSRGILNTGAGVLNIENNTIGNIAYYNNSGDELRGIRSSGGTNTIRNNTVRDMKSNATASTTFFLSGIDMLAATAGNIVAGNQVYNLTQNNATGGAIFNVGMFIGGLTSGEITKNRIYNIDGVAPTLLYGIYKLSGSATYSNNMIALNPSGADHFAGGIRDDGAAGTNNWYYNSVSIQGLSAAGVNSSYAFFRSNTATVVIRNNILSNTRTGGTGFHVAIANTNASATGWAATASDYNDIYSSTASTTAQWLGAGAGNNLSFAGWQAAQPGGSGGDANSLNIQPNFISTTDLHLVAGTNCGLDGYGTPIAGITTDYDNQARDAGAPDMGADEFATSPVSTTLASANTCDTKNVSPSGTTYINGSCNLIANLLPSGAVPVSGRVRTCVTIDAVQMYYNGAPYVQRHIDIEPAVAAATATGTVTLYFTDAEFTTYNTNNPIYPQLPTVLGGGSTDPNRINLKVTQYHGTATSSPSAPGLYTGAAAFIDPVDTDITYNGNFWEVKISVNGFSGFYVYTSSNAGPLPITINYFNGTKQGSNHLLNWKVTCTATPRATMILERSADSRNFSSINSIVADAARCNQPFNYTDAQPLNGMNYYRLKMVDADGKVSYSGIVALLNAVKGFEIISIAPNPVVTDNFKLNVASAQSAKMEIVIFDMQGKLVNRQSLSLIAGYNSMPVNVANLAAGTYSMYGITGEDRSKTIRFVKR